MQISGYEGDPQQGLLIASIQETHEQLRPIFEILPKHIDSRRDIWSTIADRRIPNVILKIIYSTSEQFLMDFESFMDDIIEFLDKERIKDMKKNYDKIIEKELEIAEGAEKIVKLEESILNEVSDPSVYFMGKRHHALSTAFLEDMERNSERNKKVLEELSNVEKFKEYVEENKDMFKTGVFLATEPLFIFSLLIADYKGEIEYISKYSELLDEISFKISNNRPEFYKKAVGIKKEKFGKDKFDEFKKARKRMKAGLS